MSFFNPEIILKEKPISKHPWEHRIKAKYSSTYKYSHNSVANPLYPAPKTEDVKRIKFIVIGNRVTKEFIYCMHLVKGLHKYRKKQFEAPVIRGVSSVEWPKVWNDLKIQFGDIAYCIKSQVIVLLNNQFLGGEQELKELIETKYIYNYPEYLDYHKEGIEQFSNYVKSTGRPCAYLHISIDDIPIGPLIFMLYADIAPLTCQNFIRLCEKTKGGYAGTPIHRIVQDSWIQCGGFALKSPLELLCENYNVPHDRRGVLSMANAGRNKDCSTQFFILLQPAHWMKHKYVAFGQLIEGEQTLKKIEDVPTWYESPTAKINIYKAGVFNMECHWRPVNKTATEYISGHIEDLVQLGALFYDALWESVNAALDEKIKAAEELLDETEKEGKDARSSEKGAKSPSVNNDFDVEVYYEDEIYNEGSSQRISDMLPDETPKSSRVVERPYYLPLTDVPYPGEVESAFNLQRLLRGDYCLESDLAPNRKEAQKQLHVCSDILDVPDGLLDSLFEYYDIETNISELSLDSDQEAEIKEYIKENVDSTCFAGSVIQKIANIEAKFKIFEGIDDKKTRFTDEEIRLFRVVGRELKARRHKRVSISRDTATPSHTKINRRQTGFVRPEDLDDLKELIDKYDKTDKGRDQMTVRLDVLDKETKGVIKRRQTGFSKLPEAAARTRTTSTLIRLYDDVSMSSDDSMPTLKTYRPTSEIHEKNHHYTYLTNSPLSLLELDTKSVPHNVIEYRFLEDTLKLQHGTKLTRKVSSDYPNTLSHLEHAGHSSLRTIEFAKQRPSISVVEYKMKNQKYQDDLKAAKDKMDQESK